MYERVGYLWKNTFSTQRPVYYNSSTKSLHYLKENSRESVIYNDQYRLIPITLEPYHKVIAENKTFHLAFDILKKK
jgi:hypothetical protein